MNGKQKQTVLAVALCLALLLAGCGKAPAQKSGAAGTPAAEVTPAVETAAPEPTPAPAGEREENETPEEEEKEMLQMKIGDTAVAVEWEENESVKALAELCEETPLVIEMSMYGGFEQVGPIGTSLPRSDVQTTTAAGDIVLYAGNQIVVFYGSNSWAYTRLGHITDKNAAEMAELLGQGDVRLSLSIGG